MKQRYTAMEWAAMEGGHEVTPTGPSFGFINELTESRMFRAPISLSGHTAQDLAQTMYMALLTIELIRHYDEDQARTYCYRTIQFGDFDHMRFSGTDLGNLMAVLGNQIDFEDRIKTNYDISAPLLQTKTYLRGVWTGSFQHGRDRQFFINLERALQINNSIFWQVRRTVLDWPQANRSERQTAMSNIRRELMRHALRLDIIEFLPKI